MEWRRGMLLGSRKNEDDHRVILCVPSRFSQSIQQCVFEPFHAIQCIQSAVGIEHLFSLPTNRLSCISSCPAIGSPAESGLWKHHRKPSEHEVRLSEKARYGIRVSPGLLRSTPRLLGRLRGCPRTTLSLAPLLSSAWLRPRSYAGFDALSSCWHPVLLRRCRWHSAISAAPSRCERS